VIGFLSFSNNLVAGDTNTFNQDAFVRDTALGTTQLMTADSNGTPSGGNPLQLSLSGDGRFVAMAVSGGVLVPGTTGTQIYVKDRMTGAVELISKDTNGVSGNDVSFNPSITPDGRYVTFESTATNLVPNDTNALQDVFIHDRQTGITELVSVNSSGNQTRFYLAQNSSPSADGRYVAFESGAPNLLPATLSYNHAINVFVRDRMMGTTSVVSVTSTGGLANFDSTHPMISANGNAVAFMSIATNLVSSDTNPQPDIFVHDLTTGATELISIAQSGHSGAFPSVYPSISGDGTRVAFMSQANDLVPGDTNMAQDIFVRDRAMSLTFRVSVGPMGVQSNADSGHSAISADGDSVAFESVASNLVAADSNGWQDIFVAPVPNSCP
jgi:hypothetical protein